jgi:integrase
MWRSISDLAHDLALPIERVRSWVERGHLAGHARGLIWTDRDVEGPDKGLEREGPYLYPAEFLRLISCERVPVRWRRLIALSAYLYRRRGELEVLDWSSVNLEQGYVHIHQADDKATGALKSTKTGHNRKVPIEPTLVPLLEMMREESRGEGRVVTSMPPDEELATRLRRYLEWSGVTRADLFADDATRRPLVWHDLRHTGASWRCIRGDATKKIQRAGGWRTASMLGRYCNEAETFEDVGTFGEVFPPLPLALFSPFPEGRTESRTGGPCPAGSGPNSSGLEASPTGRATLGIAATDLAWTAAKHATTRHLGVAG